MIQVATTIMIKKASKASFMFEDIYKKVGGFKCQKYFNVTMILSLKTI